MAIDKNEFPKIIATLQPKVGAALKVGAETIEQGAKARVPVDQGDLKGAIHTEQTGPLEFSVIAGNNDVFYGHIIEGGSVRQAPRPFLVPALEASRAHVLGLVNGALKRL